MYGGRSHPCCSQQCNAVLNALQAFPFSAWDDVAGTKLGPEEVVKARKVEIGYAEKKPVWVKIPRHVAKSKGWKIIKSRSVDVNKGDDTNPVYRSRMVGKEFNDKVIVGLCAAAPPFEYIPRFIAIGSIISPCNPAPIAGTPSGICVIENCGGAVCACIIAAYAAAGPPLVAYPFTTIVPGSNPRPSIA